MGERETDIFCSRDFDLIKRSVEFYTPYTRVYDKTFRELNFRGSRPIRENREIIYLRNLALYGTWAGTDRWLHTLLSARDIVVCGTSEP